ncbi:hypothetical protein P5V15_004742 [Pogonomyrmex californicus]
MDKSKHYKTFPKCTTVFAEFYSGCLLLLNYHRSPEQLPKWLDIDKYRRGLVHKKFVNEHFVVVILSKVIGLIYVYSFIEELKSVIMGENSHTLYLVFKKRIKWITSNLPLRAHSPNPWIPDRELLLKDFAAICPFEKLRQCPYICINKSSFLVLFLLYPQNIGIHNVADEDLEAFCHIWKCYGYFLGEDNLEEIKQRMRDFYRYWTIPNFKDITPEWEHLTRRFAMILIITDALNLNMSYLYASLSYTEWIVYKCFRFTLRYALKFSIIRAIVNAMRKLLNEALNFDVKKLAKLHKKSNKTLSDFSITY